MDFAELSPGDEVVQEYRVKVKAILDGEVILEIESSREIDGTSTEIEGRFREGEIVENEFTVVKR